MRERKRREIVSESERERKINDIQPAFACLFSINAVSQSNFMSTFIALNLPRKYA